MAAQLVSSMISCIIRGITRLTSSTANSTSDLLHESLQPLSSCELKHLNEVQGQLFGLKLRQPFTLRVSFGPSVSEPLPTLFPAKIRLHLVVRSVIHTDADIADNLYRRLLWHAKTDSAMCCMHKSTLGIAILPSFPTLCHASDTAWNVEGKARLFLHCAFPHYLSLQASPQETRPFETDLRPSTNGTTICGTEARATCSTT